MRLYDHILEIADKHRIWICWTSNYRGKAHRKNKIIKIPDVKTHITYALALHEIGHILAPQTGNRLNKEAQAWLWAKENAIEWTPVMGDKAARCIRSYLDWCQRRKGAWVPPANHISWEIAKW